MKKQIIVGCLLAMSLMACYKLHFEGNTFQTVKGTITDTLNKPISNLTLNMVTTLTNSRSGPVIVSTTSTKSDGSFQFTFPRSNGYLYVELPETYAVADSVGKIPDLHREIYIDTAKFQNFLYNTQTVKVVEP